jgi:peptidoglycan DL-endopeptidase LytF
MSRKDTIIIAVLINAGLLLILFATAISSSNEEESQPPSTTLQIAAAEEAPPLSRENIPTVPGDEVDQVLSQWSTSSTSIGANSRSYQGTQNTTAESSMALSYRADTLEDDDSAEENDERDGETATLKSISGVSAAPNGIQSFKEIKVKSGDILERIAKANGTTVQEIMKVNKLPNSQLKVGQVLKIPVNETGVSSSNSKAVNKESSARSSGAQPQYYVVKSGDNPWLIAKKNHMALDELLRLNSLDEGKARRLQPGDKIRIK